MATVMNVRKGVELLKAFGIPTENLLRARITLEPNDIVRAECTYAASIVAGDVEEVTKRFQFEEIKP